MKDKSCALHFFVLCTLLIDISLNARFLPSLINCRCRYGILKFLVRVGKFLHVYCVGRRRMVNEMFTHWIPFHEPPHSGTCLKSAPLLAVVWELFYFGRIEVS